MESVYSPVHVLMLHGVKCPFNYVKSKLVLEEMKIGEVLEVVVDEGEPSHHVPKSLKEDGQTILEVGKDEEGLVHILIEKAVEY